MLKGFLSKSFLLLFLINSVLFLIPTSVFAVPKSDIEKKCTQLTTDLGFKSTDYNCDGNIYQCTIFGGECTLLKKNTWSCLPLPGYFSLGDCVTDMANIVFSKIVWLINTVILRPILWLSSLIFDFTVYFTIVKFKTNFSDLQVGGIGTVLLGNSGSGLVYYLWGMIRDFMNIIIFMAVIFAAIYSMFDGFTNTSKKFISLLVFSIVANFSLLFVKVAIDISNILALQAYTLAVKPTSTEDFSKFRSSAVGDGPKTYGEYLRNSVDLNRLTSSENTSLTAKAEIEDMQSTLMFQIGRMVVFVGLIYILLYMAGILIVRAGYLLYAMIISPLIAADLFFNMVGKDSDTWQPLANLSRKVTNKMKGDFYDSLVKGPLLIFSIFLIGVFAESILSQGVMDTLSSSISGMKDVQQIDSSFTKSIFIFFKFGVFLALSQIIFNTINNINLGGSQLRRLGGKFANFAVGRGLGGISRLGGGIGRVAANRAFTNNGVGNRLQTRFSNIVNDTNRSDLIRGLAARGNTFLENRKTSSYDARNLKPLGKLGGLISSATETATGAKINFGTAETRGFEKIAEDKAVEAKKRREGLYEAAALGAKPTQEELDKIKNQEYGKLSAGGGLTAKELAEAIEQSKKTNVDLSNPATVIQVGNKNISGADLKIFQKGDNGISDAELTLAKANKDIEEKTVKAEAEAKKKYISKMKAQEAVGEAPKYLSEIVDRTVTDKLTGRSTQSDIREKAKIDVAAEIKEKFEKDLAKSSVFRDLTKDLGSDYRNLFDVLDRDLLDKNSPEYKAAEEKLKETQSLLLEVTPEGMTDKEKIELYKKYSSDPEKQKKLVENKKQIAETITNLLNKTKIDTFKDQIFDLNEESKGKAKTKIEKKAIDKKKRKIESYVKTLERISSSVEKSPEEVEKLEEKIKDAFGAKKTDSKDANKPKT